MKYLGAYMLAVIGGKPNPTSDDIKAILDSGGVEFEADTLSKVMSELEGKNVMDVIAAGMSKLASVPSGGGGGGGAAAPAEDKPAEEAPVEESEEEEEEEMDFDLFD